MNRVREWLKNNLWVFAAALPLVLPTYVVRFRVFGLPSTALEFYVLFLLVAFTFAFGLNGWRRASARIGAWRWPVAAWTIATFAAALWSPDIQNGIGLWRAYVLEPVFILLMMHALLEEERRREMLYRCLSALVVALAVWGVVQFLTGFGIPSPWNVSIADGRRATGPFPYPNALALLVVPIGAWAFGRWLSHRKDGWLLLAALASGVCAVVAKSDGGLLALGAAVFVSLVLFGRKTRAIALVLAVIGMLVIGLVPQIREPFLREATFQSWSGQVRLFIWRETRDMLADHWLLGAGFGGYPAVFEPYHKATAIEIFQYPHTILFNFWSETGLPGVVIFIWLIVTWARAGWRGASVHRSEALAPLVAILVHGLVDVPYFKNDLAMAFWILAFITTSASLSSSRSATAGSK